MSQETSEEKVQEGEETENMSVINGTQGSFHSNMKCLYITAIIYVRHGSYKLYINHKTINSFDYLVFLLKINFTGAHKG